MVGTAVTLLITYDLLAFAGQMPLGVLLDRWGARRAAALVGVLLTSLALFAVDFGVLWVVIFAGFGNALFHVGAGAMVVDGSPGKAAPAGFFVAPGALGLGLGLLLGRTWLWVPLWPWHLALVASMVLVLLIPVWVATEPVCLVAQQSPSAELGFIRTAVCLGLLFFSVFIRALVGTVACDACLRGLFLLCAIPVMGFLGKLTGGFLADRWGWIELSVGALLTSAPLLAFSGGDRSMVLPGLLIFQMTMPVTLAAVYRLLPHRPGMGFGFLCSALVLGTLVAQVPGGFRPSGVVVLMLILSAAAALYWVLIRLAPRAARSFSRSSPSPLTEEN
jgi:FSR family fosmidomycin resistance protein-like MFS transporter